jgi:asparagine synthase (glutamine-hydrolysing)
VTETELSPDPLTAALLEAIPVGFRPGLGSTSLFHDRQLSVTAASLGADMLFTGHGGDAVFFQPPTPWIACDLFAARRSWRTMISALTDLAAWTGTPVWAVLNAAWRARRGMIRIHGPVVPFAQTSSAKEEAPAWLDQAEDLAPAKQLQLWALGYARSAFGPSFCSAELEVRHPLLSQPLVEHVLGLSALTLTEGRRDRALARRAYAGRLPDALLARRGKGSLNRHYGQLLAGSLDVVRPYLLEGVLAERCIIVPDRLDAVLRVEALMAEDHYAAVFTILLLERWARGWEDIRAQARASPFRA